MWGVESLALSCAGGKRQEGTGQLKLTDPMKKGWLGGCWRLATRGTAESYINSPIDQKGGWVVVAHVC